MSDDPLLVLRQRVAERQARRAQNDSEISARLRENEIIDAELAAYQDALSVLGDLPENATSIRVVLPGLPTLRRGPRGPWKNVMHELSKSHSSTEFHYSTVEDVSRRVGADINTGTVRSQMANYANNRLLERLRPGWFRFTAAGLREFGGQSDTAREENHLLSNAATSDGAHEVGVSPDDDQHVTPNALIDYDQPKENPMK